MKRLVLSAAGLLAFSLPLAAQTITTGAVSSKVICGGSSVTVNYTAKGAFVPGNAFILQLSDPSGGFGTAVNNLGSISSTTSGSITVTVPNHLNGTGYRFRVIGSNPPVTGTDNGTNITIGSIPSIEIERARIKSEGNGRRVVMVGDPTTFALRSGTNIPAGASYLWNFGAGAAPATSTDAAPAAVTYATPGSKKVMLRVTTAAGCSATTTFDVNVSSLNPAVGPADFIVQTDVTPTHQWAQNFRGSVWVCPGGTFRMPILAMQDRLSVLVERGGNLVVERLEGIVYLKSGASLTLQNGYVDYGTIVYEPGASIHVVDGMEERLRRIEVPSLTFDYRKAPPGGCPSLARYIKEIPPQAHSVLKPTTADESNAEFWVREGGELTALGTGNTYSIEAGTVTALGDSCVVYLKKGSTFNAGGSKGHRIFHEVEATIINAGDGSVLLPSDSVTFVVSGVSGVEENISTGATDGMTASPNPAISSVTIGTKDPSAEIRRIVIRNTQGEIVIERNVDRIGSVSVSVEGLASGVYHIEAQTSHGRLTKSIVVTR